MQIHSGMKPNRCDKCEYTCVSGTDLKLHKRTHNTDDKCYKCDGCAYSCARFGDPACIYKELVYRRIDKSKAYEKYSERYEIGEEEWKRQYTAFRKLDIYKEQFIYS